MTLAALKAALQVTGTTGVGEVIFDWQYYLDEVRDNTYPIVLWNLSGAKIQKKDIRDGNKHIKLSVFIIGPVGEDKIPTWDTLETILDAYLISVNGMTSITIDNLNNLEGDYYPEALLSANSDIGIGYSIDLHTWC